jgi:tetratricopeptide (TPR) repeat protein
VSSRASRIRSRPARPPRPSAALGQAARLAEELGEIDRAAAAWSKRLDVEATDRTAIDGLVELFERAKRWEALCEALRRRVKAAASPTQRRADLVRIATVQAQEIAATAAAIDTWTEIQQTFGEDAEVVAVLADLLATAARWADLAELLARASHRHGGGFADLNVRLADVYREKLNEPVRAVTFYARALEMSPGHGGAIAGLRPLVEVETCRAAAAEALAASFRRTGDYKLERELLETRLGTAADDGVRVKLLLDGAGMEEKRSDDARAALALVARAMPLAPDDTLIERELVRLAARTGEFAVAADAMKGAAATLPKDARRGLQLRFLEGGLRETQLRDPAAALDAYRVAFEREPARVDAREAVVRTAARAGRWDVATQSALATPVLREVLERTLLPLLEAAASEAGALGALAEALQVAVAAAVTEGRAEAGLARDLEAQVARLLEAAEPSRPAPVEAALARAAAHARKARFGDAGAAAGPLAAAELPLLRRLATLQRTRPGRALYETLLQVADLAPADLDPLVEAAELALGPLAADGQAPALLGRVLDQAGRLLRHGQPAEGQKPAEGTAAWAVEELARLMLARPDRSAWARAVDLLLDGTRLPLSKEAVRALRHRAAEVALEKVRDRRLGAAILRQLVDEDFGDAEAVARLAALYEEDKRMPELLALKAEELGRTPSLERRLQLRLDMEKIAAALEERSGRIETLRANLEEQPGHTATIDTLSAVLESKFRHAELADVLTDQARRLEQRSDASTAAGLWARVARLSEGPLKDRERALACHERVAELEPTAVTYRALGRLVLDKGEALAAAGWMEKWLAQAEAAERTRAALELSAAYVKGDRRHRAIACLERALGEQPVAHDVRAALIGLYRQGESWEALVRVLSDGCAHLTDVETILSYAREAAELSQGKLGSPAPALTALEKAVTLVPADRALRTTLADALIATGALDRARDILQALLKEAGRRRSKERAAVHHRVARVARAQKNLAEAIEHLEQAAEMDMDHAGILEMLAQVAEELDNPDRAERAYRALILLARREGSGATLSPGEVLLRLRRIALGRGQTDKAADLLESAVAEAMSSPAEAQRIQKALAGAGDAEVLRKVLEMRLATATDEASQADVLADLGALEEGAGDHAAALDRYLSALEKAPDDLGRHEHTRAVARAAKQSEKYLTSLAALVENKRRVGDAAIMTRLQLVAGEVAELDLGDKERAAELYGKASQGGVEAGEPAVRAAAALVRVARTPSERSKAIKALTRLGGENVPDDVRVEALFCLAEAQLGGEDTRDKGLEALAEALERRPDIDRAFALVRGAKVPDSDLARVLPLYERVARGSGDDGMLLDYLERRAAIPGTTAEELREAVDLAVSLNEPARAEALLKRAVELLKGRSEPSSKMMEWALLELAQIRKNAGDVNGAVAWLEEARDVADPVRVLRHFQEIAQKALFGGGDPAVAARVYERLWEREPAERRWWEPLLDLYGRLEDRAGAERVARATIERTFDAVERTAVRIAWARLLLAIDQRDKSAEETLRDVLLEDPTNRDAIALLADVYQATGNEAGLQDLLVREIDAARSRNDVPGVVSLSLRLGGRLGPTQPEGAREVLRAALKLAPDDRELLKALLALVPSDTESEADVDEKARLLERLLGLEPDEGVAALALELADLWGRLDKEDRQRAVLESAWKRAPGHRGLYERLCDFYRERKAWEPLATVLSEAASRASSPVEQAALWREAADVYRKTLRRAREAAELLRLARNAVPMDGELLRELVETLDALGDRAGAADEVGRAVSAAVGADRVPLLKLSADLREKAGDSAAAVADLEQAVTLDASVEPALREALGRWRAVAASSKDDGAERTATLRLVQLLTASGEVDEARAVLADWCWRHADDREALRLLRARDEVAERWDAVADTCARLVQVEQGPEQVEAVEALVSACAKAGRPHAAIEGVEALLTAQPENPWAFEKLMELYESAGEPNKQAALLAWDAERTQDEGRRFDAFRRAGELFLKQNNLAAAADTFAKAAALRPNDKALAMLVAETYIGDGRLAEAEDMLQELMKKGGKDLSSAELSNLQHKMGQLAAARGDEPGRLEWLKKAFETNRKNGEVAVELADLAEVGNDFDLAVKALRAITLLPAPGPMTPAMAFFRQARIAQRTGDRPRAVIFAKRALQEDPRLGEAADFLKELGERRV